MSLEQVTVTPDQNIVGSLTHDLKQTFSTIMMRDAIHLQVDLQHVTMIDSLGIGVLVATRNRLKDSNNGFSIINLSPELTQLFSNMRIIEFLNIR